MNFADTIKAGTRIRAFREQKNLTLKELASRTGLDVGQLSRIESNKVGARESTFHRIAAGLGVPAETFLLKPTGRMCSGNRPTVSFPISSLHLRPQTSHHFIIARENCREALEAAQAIEEAAGVGLRVLVQLARPILPTARGAELLARQVRHMFGIGAALCHDYPDLFARHGIRTLELQMSATVDSLSVYDAERSQATIFLSSGSPLQPNTQERKTYCLVTELANILLENARTYGILESAPADELLSDEKFARHFAALFLIPAEAVQETVRQYRLTPARWTYDLMLSVKSRFGVSAQAFCYRLLELGYITEALAADFRSRIEAHYEKSKEKRVKSKNEDVTSPLTLHPSPVTLSQEPAPSDPASRINAFLHDLLRLLPAQNHRKEDVRKALDTLRKLDAIDG